jgi:hypothetical protein
MKRVFTLAAIIAVIVFAPAYSQDEGKKDPQEQIDELKSQVGGMDEVIKELQTDRDALKKIKVSGYLQVQFEKSEKETGFAADPYDAKDYVKARFNLRRSRIKIQYDGGSTQMVVQGDYSNAGFALKDAYLEFTEQWTKMLSMRFGVFNRPNYEVEYSSSQRESPERSGVIRALYPGERDLGAMLTFAPEGLFNLQLAAFNNTFKGTFSQTGPNFGSEPLYFMARLTKSFAFDDLGIDLGVHGRFGNVRLNSAKVLDKDMLLSDKPDSVTYKVGDAVGRNWFGVEAQLYYDFLGGMKVLGEYIMGSDVNELGTTPGTVRVRDFTGFYVMLVKNLGTDHQIAVKYDSYVPNSKADYDAIGSSAELATNTLGFGIHDYTFPNVRLTLWYDMPMRKTNTFANSNGVKLFDVDPKDNQLTFRAQYKF